MIDITGVDLVKFAQKVYALSVPRGLGFIHHTFDPLSETDAKRLVQPTGRIALSMDYVMGRGCKMTVYRSEAGKLTISDSWYDHTDSDLQTLLKHFNLTPNKSTEHNVSCECNDCVRKRQTV